MTSKILFPNFEKGGNTEKTFRLPNSTFNTLQENSLFINFINIYPKSPFLSYNAKLPIEIIPDSVKVGYKSYRISLNVDYIYRIFPNQTIEEIQSFLIYEWYVDGVLESTLSAKDEGFELINDYVNKLIQVKIINSNNGEEWLSNTISTNYILNISLNNVISLNFKNGDKISRYGLNQSEMDTLYSETTLEGKVVNNGDGVQKFQIPETTGYKFQCFGAKGGGNYGGKGAYVEGIFTLEAEDWIQVGCGNPGQQDSDETTGGGASWVAKELNNGDLELLLIAGGGGGSHYNQSEVSDGSSSLHGNKSIASSTNAPGVNGSGGYSPSWDYWNGCGWHIGNGREAAIKDNPRGNTHDLDGGFGGGGGVDDWSDGCGGGGGYSGGAGGEREDKIGGGGGSFNSGKFQVNISGYNDGHGKVNCSYYSSTIDDYFDIISTPTINKEIIGEVLVLNVNFEFDSFKLFDLKIKDLDITYEWYKDGTLISRNWYNYEVDLTNDVGSEFYVQLTNNKTGNVYTSNTLTIDSNDTVFNIKHLNGINLYLDANETSNITTDSNDRILDWKNKLGDELATQTDSSLQPLLQIDSWNTHNTVYFDNDKHLLIDPDFQTDNNIWLFLIKLETSHSKIAIAGSDLDYFTVAQDGNSDGKYVYFRHFGLDVTPPKRLNLKSTGNDLSISSRGDLYTALTNTAGLVFKMTNFPKIERTISLGNSTRSTSWYANGEFQSIICLDAHYKDIEIITKQLTGLLAHRVGIDTNLPTDHPYKNNAPVLSNQGSSSITINQEGILVYIDSSNFYFNSIYDFEKLYLNSYIYSLQWFLDGVEISNNKKININYDDSDVGKEIYLEIKDFLNNSIISNTFTINSLQTLYVLNFSESDQLEIPISSYPSGNKITIEFWMYGTSNSYNENTYFLETNNSSGNRSINLHHTWDNGRVYWDCGDDGSGYDRISKYISEANYTGWHHWAFTKNTNLGEMKIFLDGVEWYSETSKTKSFSSDFINHHIGGNMKEFKLKNLRIWNIDRTATEINNNKNTILKNETNLVSSYPLLEYAGDIAHDYSGNNNHGTINGATWELDN